MTEAARDQNPTGRPAEGDEPPLAAASTKEPMVVITGVNKHFGDLHVLRDIDLTVGRGEVVVVLGPSGSGKSTLCRTINRLEAYESGSITIDDKTLPDEGKALAQLRADVGMVFHPLNLFAHKTILENVTLGPMKVRKKSKAEAEAKARELLARVGVTTQADKYPAQLSGGQQQRVALARAIIIEPDLLLMDEPLGALDRQLRRHVQLEIRRLHEQSRRTTIYVTHDQEEALVMSDRIAVLNSGRLEQVGTPAELYRQPKNVFVATFLGESNLLRVTVVSRQATCIVFRLEGTEQTFKIPAYPDISQQDTAQLLVRPEDFRVESDGSGLAAEVLETVYLGELSAIRLRLQSGDLVWMRSMSSPHVKVGDRIRVSWEPGKARLLDQ